MEKGKVRRLMLKALNELGTGEKGYEEIIDKMVELSNKEIGRKELLNFDNPNQLYNSPFLEAIEYLEEKGFIKTNQILSSDSTAPGLIWAKITAYGKDIVDNQNKLDMEIPISTVQQNIKIAGGNVAIAGQGNANLNIQEMIDSVPDEIREEFNEFKKEILQSISKKEGLKEFIKNTGVNVFATLLATIITQQIGS